MLKYIKSIKEELRVSEIDDSTIDTMKYNLINKLSEYREYILSNIKHDDKTNDITYKNFDSLEIDVILRELANEFTIEFLQDINIEAFIRKINQLFVLKKENVKKTIRQAFDDYFSSLSDRIEFLKMVPTNDDYFDEFEGEKSIIGRKQYNSEKYKLQVELLKLQEWLIANNKKLAIVFEGRDAAGKGSTIKRFTEYLNPNKFKIVTLGIPTEDEKNNWFKRYEAHLPKNGEIVFFDRSWYNRAVIEPAMGYCTEEQYKSFMDDVIGWEKDLIKNKDIILIKLWFSITKEKQLQRFEIRKKSPLKYWKFSKNDDKVLTKWDIISKFKIQMFNRTSTNIAPWVIINSNDKKIGRLNAIRYVLSVIDYKDKIKKECKYYTEVVNILK